MGILTININGELPSTYILHAHTYTHTHTHTAPLPTYKGSLHTSRLRVVIASIINRDVR